MSDKTGTESAGRAPLTVLAEDERLFADSCRSFAEKRIRPLVRQMDEAARLDSGVIPELFEMGLMSIHVPDQYGGAGGSFFMSVLAVEEISRVDASFGVFVDVQNTLVNNAIMRWGSEEQKSRLLPRLAESAVGAYALSEAGSGSDAFALAARAVASEGGYTINGRKLWITNAAEAEIFIVFANIDPAAGYRGITAFIIERDTPGFSVGRKEDKLGIRASSTCELILENCVVPEESVLGEAGKGYKIAIETLNEGRIGIGAQMVGLAQGSWECGRDYAKERHAFGKPIAEFQAVQFQLAEAATDIEAARLMVYNAARLKDAGDSFLKEAAMAKYFASQVAERVTSMVVEIYGGYGYTRDYPAEKYFRDSKIGKIYEGTSNMQLQTIARYLLK
ncbi:MAG TPA: acyl-CoA dehydrogenase [Terriglobia bacterium]|nr:acyl-CoA dehydrogenase [Terriglobia bacterium]